MLREHRHGSRAEVPEGGGASVIQQSAVVHGGDFGPLRPVERRRGREASECPPRALLSRRPWLYF